jgi:pSer/pThr/pTyr-binding forkhead associated (FHA) protein
MATNLVFLAKNGVQKAFPLPSNVTVIGRRRNCDLRIPLDSVSRRHCQLSVENGNLKVRDLGSRNGTFLNGKRIEEDVAYAGDFIQIGPVLFGLQIDGKPEKIVMPRPAAKPKAARPSKAKPSPSAPASEQQDGFEDLEGSGSFADLDLVDGSLEDLDKP